MVVVPAAAAADDAEEGLPPPAPAPAVVDGALTALDTPPLLATLVVAAEPELADAAGVELAVSSLDELSTGAGSVEVGAAALDESLPPPLPEQLPLPPKQLQPWSRLTSQVQPCAQYQFVSTPEQGTLGPAGLGHVLDET